MKRRAEYPTIHPQVAFVMSKGQGAKYLYNVILGKKIKGVKNTWESGWEIRYGEINWVEIYQSMYHNSSVYRHILSYKVITQIVATNRLLYAMGIEDSPNCKRCKLHIENIEHKFLYCEEVKEFWENVATFVNNSRLVANAITFTPKMIILGVTEDEVVDRIVSVGKECIIKYRIPSLALLIMKLEIEISKERCVAQNRRETLKFVERWGKVEKVLANRI